MGHEKSGPQDFQDTLFELTELQSPAEELAELDSRIAQTTSLEELALLVRRSRQLRQPAPESVSPQSEPAAEVPKAETDVPKTRERVSFKNGSFATGLRRWVNRTQPELPVSHVTAHDIALLNPKSIAQQLHPTTDTLVYDGVLLTAKEFKRVTLSPRALSVRVGAQALAKEDERTPSEQKNRSKELQLQALNKREEAVAIAATEAREGLNTAERLRKEMEVTRYSHMTEQHMDELMATSAENFRAMLKAITQNHHLETERVEALNATLEFLLANDDLKKAEYFWKDINSVYIDWTSEKLQAFDGVAQKIHAQKRSLDND